MHTFSKKERLCHRPTIERLYASRKKMLVFPLSVHWMTVEPRAGASRLQVLIVAPKKKLRHAVDRNRTKRIMRECYRTRKHKLLSMLEEQDRAAVVSINYISDSLPDFHKMEVSFDRMTEKLINEMLHD